MKSIISTILLFCLINQVSLAQEISLSGIIWIENDYNNLFDGEGGVNDVKVYLFNVDTNEIIDSAFTVNFEFNFPSTDTTVIPPGNYILEIAFEAFDTGGALQSFISCPGSNDANDFVDDDDNGNDNIPVQTNPFSLETGVGTVNYIDFCFFSDCNEEILFAQESCDFITDDDIFCSITSLANLCGLMPVNNSQGIQPIPLCPEGGAPHNISWFAFVADAGNYELTVTPTGCTGSTTGLDGVQMGLYTDCTFQEAVYCNPDCNLESVTFESELLIPGNVYYFFIDGCSGSVCSYEVDVTGNPTPPQFEIEELCLFEDGDFICEDQTYCVGESIWIGTNTSTASATYFWEITTLSGVSYGEDSLLTTETNALDLMINTPGTYSICLTKIEHPCANLSWEGNVCRIVTISTTPLNEVFDTIALCEDSLAVFDINLINDQDPNGDGITGWIDLDFEFEFGNNTSEVMDSNSCPYLQELFITKIENPFINLNPSSESICVGDTLSFNPTTNVNYDSITWFINGIQQTEDVGVFSPTPGTFDISTTIYNACGSSSDEVQIQISDTISAPNITCDNSNVGLITLSWDLIEGTEGYWLSINEDSTFVVTDSFYVIEDLASGEMVTIEFNLIDSTKCVGSSTMITCTAQTVVGLQELEENNMQIVPNPTYGIITIDEDIPSSNVTFLIYSIDGKLVLSGNLDETKMINVMDLSSGLYIVAIAENGSKIKRIGRFVKSE